MAVTHGGRAIGFGWSLVKSELRVESESGMQHTYTVDEILRIIRSLHDTFGDSWIPLANNVEKMYNGTEKPGLGMTIYKQRPGETVHAQGASYLGVVLEEVGVFAWNGAKRNIAWRLVNLTDDAASLLTLLKTPPSNNDG